MLKDGGQLLRQQVVKLLELCMKFDIIEDVKSSDGITTSFCGDQKHLYCFVMERPSLFGDIITSDTSSYTRGDTGRDTSGDTARHTGRGTGGDTAEDTSHKDSSIESSLCIGNQHFWQSPVVRIEFQWVVQLKHQLDRRENVL